MQAYNELGSVRSSVYISECVRRKEKQVPRVSVLANGKIKQGKRLIVSFIFLRLTVRRTNVKKNGRFRQAHH